MAVLLSSVVQSPASSPGSVVEAVKHLLQLRADGAACAEQLDPVHMCLQSKVIHSVRRTQALHMCACHHGQQGCPNSLRMCLQSMVHAKQGRANLVCICLQS